MPAAVAPIRPLGWELPCALGASLKRTKRQKKKKNVQVLSSDVLQHLKIVKRRRIPAKTYPEWSVR